MKLADVIADLKSCLSEFLKPDQISDRPDILDRYSQDYSYDLRGSPFLVVFPTCRKQLQSIIKVAAERRIPLVPVSSGPPHFRGDTIPEQGGIIVDFSLMTHIINIDETNRYAWIEPGVTYGQLMPELRKHNLKIDAPLLPRASKSVVTSRLEREPVIIPKYQYDYLDPLLTLEVVYGTGDDFRTGSASGPGPVEALKADKVNPWGPGTIDFYRFVSGAQGTLGFVTWALTKVEVLPEIHQLYFVPVQNAKTATDIMNRLLRRRIGDECLALNNVSLAAILAENWPADYIKLKKNLPDWTVLVCISGYRLRPEERIAIQQKYLFDICGELGAKPSPFLPGAEGREGFIPDLLTGPWLKEPYWKLAYKAYCQDIFFLSTLGQAADFIPVMQSVAAKFDYLLDDLGGYLQPLVQGRGCHCEYNLFFDESNQGRVKQLFIEASETLKQKGAFFSRPYGPWANMVYADNAAGVAALKKLKGIFDPDNILNPGKLCF